MGIIDFILGAEPIDDPNQYFGSRWGRLKDALADNAWPVADVFCTSIMAYAAFDARLPDPPTWLLNFSVAATVVGIPCYFIGRAIARRLLPLIGVKVVEIDGPGENDFTPYIVPPKTWKERDVRGIDAYKADNSDVWVVWDLDYHGDINQLEVMGVEYSIVNPREIWKSAARTDKIYTDLIERLIKRNTQLALMEDAAIDIHDEAVGTFLEFDELGRLPDDIDVASAIDDVRKESEDLLNFDEMDFEPGGEETGAAADRIDADVDETANGAANGGGEWIDYQGDPLVDDPQ